MNILVYETNMNGHRLEYIHHLYMLSFCMPEDIFVFVLSERYNKIKDMFEWPKSPNVIISLIQAKDEQPTGRPSLVTLFREQRNRALVINSYISQYRIDRIFAIVLLNYFPFLPLFLKKGVRVDGIQYSLFPWSNKGFLLSKVDYIKYYFYKFFGVFGKVYTLNDEKSAKRLNKVFRTDKFKYIPDPFVPIIKESETKFRKDHEIKSEEVVFAHFGGLQSRKGTLLILESIKRLKPDEKEKYVFVFAGRVYDEIKNEFYTLYNEIKNEARIIIKDEFCSYEYIAALCEGCNAILMPYYQTTQSSGLLGYASQFRKPVIAPSQNLIGDLVKRFNLGYLLPDLSIESLLNAYKAVNNKEVDNPTSKYCEINSVNNFQNVIKEGFLTSK